MKIGITGISGRLGSLVATQLSRESHEVVGSDRRTANRVSKHIKIHCIDVVASDVGMIFGGTIRCGHSFERVAFTEGEESRQRYSTNIGTSRVMSACEIWCEEDGLSE